jgi:molybdopterin molybdotransferase
VRVRCFRRPRVLLLSTGDELRGVGEKLKPGEIVNTNRYTLSAAIEETGAEVVDAGVARDALDELVRGVGQVSSVDLIVSSGGVSMGKYDLVRNLLEQNKGIDFWQVALRPGRPLAFGIYEGRPFIGLPGNPVSALVCFELFVRPALRSMQGLPPGPRLQPAVTDDDLESPPHLEQYFRTVARRNEEGVIHVRLTGDQGSHVLRSMSDANSLTRVPQGAGRLAAGAAVEIIELAPIS